MPLGEYCLPSSNVFSHHCPDVLTNSILIDTEYHEMQTFLPVSISTVRGGLFCRIDLNQYL